jgi:uncharacterized oligopeptide transporter (OPT) family protein
MPTAERRWGFLPAPGTPKYHLMLGAIGLVILGPICGVTIAYMGFRLGFLVASQILAGILGSVATVGYGPEGKHGANYLQTMAASVASMSGMAVLVQAMVWLNMAMPPAWVMVLYFTCIGMFGVGVGMLYTPLVVDKLQLEYPSGHAVANILRALTDPQLLRRSVAKLGGGTGIGIVAAALVERVRWMGAIDVSPSGVGTGMICGSRITVPAMLMATVGYALTPYLRGIGWLGPEDPFRKIGFLIALAMIMGASLVDLLLLAVEAARKLRARRGASEAAPAARRGLSTGRLLAWTVVWGAALVAVSTQLLHQPVGFVLLAIALSFVFVLVNGISLGITDSNPISSAFVASVLVMSAAGLTDPVVGMLAASILLVACTVGGDMQQDRSTGWRLGSDRTMQFRYQAIGIAVGGVACVAFASLFMYLYPVLRIDSFAHPEATATGWQSAMTFKFVGAIRDIGHLAPYKVRALEIGFGIGLGVQIARKLLVRAPRYRAFVDSGPVGFTVGWIVDALLLASPYATSFGGFFNLAPCSWFGLGGVITSVVGTIEARGRPAAGEDEDALPADMSTTSLVGGGLIAGESLYMLVAGIVGMVGMLAR